jgi:AhpD family alkylhydroperoxidase
MSNREKIFAEIKQTLGQVPGFFESIPDESLEAEWALFKRFELRPSAIDPKVRQLIGAAVAAAGHCWYCTNFHTGMARFHGATDAEVQEAVHLAKFGTGWSTYLNGLNYDRERFQRELEEVGGYLKSQQLATA